MGHGPNRARRSTRRLLLGGLAATAIAAGVALPTSAAFAVDDYPVPPPPTIEPNNNSRNNGPAGNTGNSRTGNTGNSRTGTEVLGAQVSRGSLPFTGGDIVGIAAIGAGSVAVGAVLVRRSRRAGVGANV